MKKVVAATAPSLARHPHVTVTQPSMGSIKLSPFHGEEMKAHKGDDLGTGIKVILRPKPTLWPVTPHGSPGSRVGLCFLSLRTNLRALVSKVESELLPPWKAVAFPSYGPTPCASPFLSGSKTAHTQQHTVLVQITYLCNLKKLYST